MKLFGNRNILREFGNRSPADCRSIGRLSLTVSLRSAGSRARRAFQFAASEDPIDRIRNHSGLRGSGPTVRKVCGKVPDFFDPEAMEEFADDPGAFKSTRRRKFRSLRAL